MTFAYPFLLWLLLLVPPLIWWRIRRRRPAVHFPDGSLLRKLPVSLSVRLQPILPLLFAAGLACLIVALARPQRGLQESRVNTEGVEIVLLLDLSPSMSDRISRSQTKLSAAKRVIIEFIEKRTEDRIGMVGFASLPYSIAPLTLDHAWLTRRVSQLDAHSFGRSTAIGDAIASAANRLRDSDAKSRIIILLTDGENTDGTLTPENAAQAAAALGLKIYCVGFGMERRIGEPTLQHIAKTTNAQFFRAKDLATLSSVYNQIDQLEKTEIEMQQFTRYEETATRWLLAALLFLTLEKLLALSRFGRLPS